MAMFPISSLDVVRIVEVVGPENERWLGRTIAEVVEERGGHPSDVLADFVLENDCRPGLVAVGMANADIDGVARHPAGPRVLISSSDSGAHAQMMCSSGDTTLLLTRHVRERDDFTLEEAVYQLTGDRPTCSASTGAAGSRPATSPTSTCSRSTSSPTAVTSSCTTCPGRRAHAATHGRLPQHPPRRHRRTGGRRAHRGTSRSRHQLDRLTDNTFRRPSHSQIALNHWRASRTNCTRSSGFVVKTSCSYQPR